MKQLGLQDARNEQLTLFVRLGAELDKVTRIPGLRMMLRMMRTPAVAAGLQYLQYFWNMDLIHSRLCNAVQPEQALFSISSKLASQHGLHVYTMSAQ